MPARLEEEELIKAFAGRGGGGGEGDRTHAHLPPRLYNSRQPTDVGPAPRRLLKGPGETPCFGNRSLVSFLLLPDSHVMLSSCVCAPESQ